MRNEAKQELINFLQNSLERHKAKLAAWNTPGVLRGEQWIVYVDGMIREFEFNDGHVVMKSGHNLAPMLFNQFVAHQVSNVFDGVVFRYDMFLNNEINDLEDRIEQVNKL